MGKVNLTIGRIALWVSGVLLLFGIFGDWYAMDDEGATLFTMWDAGEGLDFGAGFILGLLAILIGIVFIATIVFDYVGEKKIAKFGALGVGGASVLTFLIGLIAKPKFEVPEGFEEYVKDMPGFDISYGLILLLIGGIIFALAWFIDEKMGAGANISFNTGAAPFSQNSMNSAKKFCPGCGAEVSIDAPFCSSCGNKL